MWTEADLTADDDLRSVYGQAAVDARLWATVLRLEASVAAQAARLQAMAAASRPAPPAPSSE